MDGLHLNMTILPYCGKFGLATLAIKVQDLLNYTTINPMVQRKLSSAQRKKIANYLQERELDRVFFGPVTLSLKEDQLAKDQDKLILRHGSKLSILDGQHRILALGYINEQLLKEAHKHEKHVSALKIKQRKQPTNMEISEELQQLNGLLEQKESRRLALMETELAVQIYIGMREEEEKQLFGDINSKILLVNKELGHSFDSSDPLNDVIRQVAEHNLLLKSAGVEKRNNLTAYNRNFTCSSWLYSTASLLFTGKAQPTYELARKIRQTPSVYVELLHQFFNKLLTLMPELPGLSQWTASSRIVQEGIALYAHGYLTGDASIVGEHWTDCLHVLEPFDWSHDHAQLAERFGKMENGKINLAYDKSLRKHADLVHYLRELNGDAQTELASLA